MSNIQIGFKRETTFGVQSTVIGERVTRAGIRSPSSQFIKKTRKGYEVMDARCYYRRLIGDTLRTYWRLIDGTTFWLDVEPEKSALIKSGVYYTFDSL